MGVDTKGFVATTFKDSELILGLVAGALSRYAPAPRIGMVDPGHAKVNFADRMMSVFFDCDCDHADIAPAGSISFSLGAHGVSVAAMRAVLESLAFLGPVYICENDLVDDYSEMQTWRRDLIAAANACPGYDLSASFSKWVDARQSGSTCIALGVPLERAVEIAALPAARRTERIHDLIALRTGILPEVVIDCL